MSAAPGEASGIGIRTAELATAALLAAGGAAAMLDGVRLGTGWAEDGPMAGYFPFWLGLGLVLASLGNALVALRPGVGRRIFITWDQARHVGAVLAPTAVFVALIGPFGIYAPSILLIVYFMLVLGRFRWFSAVGVAASVAVLTFATFEIWFLVPLPKGPIESALGF